MRHLGRFLTNSYKDGFKTIPPRTLFRLGICKGHLVQTRTKQSRNLRNQHLKGWVFRLPTRHHDSDTSFPTWDARKASKLSANLKGSAESPISSWCHRCQPFTCKLHPQVPMAQEVTNHVVLTQWNLNSEYKKIERFWKIGCYEVLDFCKHEWSRSCFFTIFLFLLSFFKSWPC